MENKRNLEKANLPKLSWSQKLGDKNSFRLNALPKGSGGTTGAGSNNFNNGGGRPDADNGKSHGAFASVIVKKGHDYPDLIGVEIFAVIFFFTKRLFQIHRDSMSFWHSRFSGKKKKNFGSKKINIVV